MQTYLKSRPVGIQLILFMGLAFGIFSIFGLIGATVLPNITGIDLLTFQDVNKWDSNDPNTVVFVRGMLVLQFLGLFLIPVLLFGYFSDPKPMHYLGLRRPHSIVYFLLGSAALILAIPLVEYIGLINKKLVVGNEGTEWMKTLEENASKQLKFMLGGRTITEYLLNLLFIAVFAAVGEELFFRGVLQRLFIRLTKNPWIGILLAAVLFSGFHLQFYGFFPRLLLGIILGVVYWYSGSLWTAIVAHFVYDAFLITLIYISPNLADENATIMEPGKLALMAFVSFLVTSVLVYTMIKRSRSDYNEEYKDDLNPEIKNY